MCLMGRVYHALRSASLKFFFGRFIFAVVCRLPVEDRDKVKAEWRAESGNTIDVYKKAVYCALLGGDVPEVCDNLENWLWLKLAPYAFSVTLSPKMFAGLQRAISIEYGKCFY